MEVDVYQGKKKSDQFLLVPSGTMADAMPRELNERYDLDRPFKTLNLTGDRSRIALDSKEVLENIKKEGYDEESIQITFSENEKSI